MISEFLKVYVENLLIFSLEINKRQELIQISNNNIKTLASAVQEKLKRLFAEMTNKESFDMESIEQNSQIKSIYLLMKQIQKIDVEKRSQTRNACDILDKYLESLDEHLKKFEINNDGDMDLLHAIHSIKPVIRQPVGGRALVVDLIKKMEIDESKNLNQSDLMVIDDVNENDEVFSQSTIAGMSLKNQPAGDNFESKSNVSELIHRLDNLQHFTEKIFDIGLDMRSRYRIEEPDNHDTPTNNDDSDSDSDTDSTTEEDAELCHCRSQDMGKMVACDNATCKIKWYHFECVGLYTNPEGRWYCPSCLIFENVTN